MELVPQLPFDFIFYKKPFEKVRGLQPQPLSTTPTCSCNLTLVQHGHDQVHGLQLHSRWAPLLQL